MVWDLLGDIIGSTSILMLPIAAKSLTKDGIERLFEAFRLLVESRQVPLNDDLHAREGIIVRNCFGYQVGVIEGVGELVEEGTWLEYEGRQNDLR